MSIELISQTLAEHMISIILVAAAFECILLLHINHRANSQHHKLRDVYHNVTKGMNDIPDKLWSQTGFDQTNALLVFIERKLSSRATELGWLKRNISAQLEKNAINDVHPIKDKFGVASTLVQIFPLLGIFGTILALGNITIANGAISGSDITQAFVIAIDTTILGIFFAIIFMLWESKTASKVENIVSSTERTTQLFSKALA